MSTHSDFLPQGLGASLKNFAKRLLGGVISLSGILLLIALFFYNPNLNSIGIASNFGEQNLMGHIIDFCKYSFGFIPAMFLFACVGRVGYFMLMKKETEKSNQYILLSFLTTFFIGVTAFGFISTDNSFGGLLGAIIANDFKSLMGSTIIVFGILLSGLFFMMAGKILNITFGDVKYIVKKLGSFIHWVLSVFHMTKPASLDFSYIDDEDMGSDVAPTKTKRKKQTSRATVKKPVVKEIVIDEPFFQLPPPEFLEKSVFSKTSVTSEHKMQAVAMETNFQNFNVYGKVHGIQPGPIVTLYEFKPEQGIRISKVTETVDDMMLAMASDKIRMAVIPRTNYIGIEMVNITRQDLRFQNLITTPEFLNSKFGIPLALGVNIGGTPMYFDLAKMPHLMIAGRTGSGKSVFVQSIIMSILYKFTPEQCKLVIVDPKGVDFTLWEKIPHLATPILTDGTTAVNALKWSVREMEERYKKLKKLGVQNIEGYNDEVRALRKSGKPVTEQVAVGTNPETGELEFETKNIDLSDMPYLVIIIDEVADLMTVARKDVELCVQRLAQKARAAGIHLVMATQRPSADVITGVIKSNFPTRISFQARSNIDSMTTLGQKGAENLLSCGDMLFSEAGKAPVRIHGALIVNKEINRVAKFLKDQGEPEYTVDVSDEESFGGAVADIMPGAGGKDAKNADLYEQAKTIVLRDKKPTISYLQRRLEIGYNKAATLIEKMEADGIISPPDGNNKRQIL